MVKPSEQTPQGIMSGLHALQPLPTAAERAAEVIRENIFEGRFAPGMPLPESTLSAALQVSRNTVREAFRTLISEHLLTYEAHKGVMVRWLTVDDVHDIYKLRRMLELSAFDLVIAGSQFNHMEEISEMVATAEREAEEGRWTEVGTTNLRFHQLIVGIHQSARADELFQRLMTELRLGFLAALDLTTFHGQFLVRNRKIYDLMTAQNFEKARAELKAYLDDAEESVVEAVQK